MGEEIHEENGGRTETGEGGSGWYKVGEGGEKGGEAGKVDVGGSEIKRKVSGRGGSERVWKRENGWSGKGRRGRGNRHDGIMVNPNSATC